MITQLKIENYKSIQDLTLDVGRVNVLIGENGCGKSNILEAITLAAAAEANKLDNEFLKNRGIRVTEPLLMRSAFKNETKIEPIKITVKFNGSEVEYFIHNDNKPYGQWEVYYNENTYHSKKKASFAENFIRSMDSSVFFFQEYIIYSPENTALRNFSKEANIEPLGDKGEGLLKLLIITQHEEKNSEQLNQELERFNDIQETLELFGWFDSIQIPDDFSLLEKKITIQDRYLEMPFDQRSANEGFLLVLFYITLVVSKYTPKIFAIDNIDTSLNPKLCTKLIKELARLADKYKKQIFLTSHNPAILDGIDLGDPEQRLFVVSRNKQGHTRCKRIDISDKPKSSVRDMLSRLFKDNETYTKKDILTKFDNDDDPLDISYGFSKAFDDKEIYSKDDILNKFDNSEEPVKLSYALLRGYLGGLPKNF